nr:tRNA/rRNA methyltransferase (SpoU) family protein [Tanacetum cinerariifolium]
MAPLTFADTHNMVTYLSKSNASEGFDQIMDFLNVHTIQYALVVNPTIYVSCIKQLWATATIKKVNDAVQLRALIDAKYVVVFEDIIRRDIHLDDADEVECLPNEEIFKALRTAWNEFSCSMASVVICLATSRRVGKGFSGVETPLFASMLVQPQPPAEEEEKENEMPIAPLPPPQDPTPTPHATPLQDQPSTPLASPPQAQPTSPHDSTMPLLTTLMETCASLSQKVAELEQDKHTQALEILQLKKRVKKLEKKKRSKSLGFKRLRKVGGGKIEAIDADEEITMVDVETQEEVVAMDAEPQGRINQENVNAVSKEVSAAEPTVFDDEEVQERHLDNIRKYQSLKKKPILVAQARKSIIIYLKNIAGYKMEHFREMTYDKVRPIFEKEYKKVQTLFKPDKDVEEPKKKRVADETLLQETSKFKVEALQVKYPIIDWEIHNEGSRTYWKIIRVGEITEAYQIFEDMLKGFDIEDLVSLWNSVKERFSSTVHSEDKEKALWVELKRLFKPDATDRSSDEDLHGGQQTKEQKFRYILQVIKGSRSIQVKRPTTLVSNLASLAKTYSFGRVGLTSLAGCVAAAAFGISKPTKNEAKKYDEALRMKSDTYSTYYNDKATLLDVFRIIIVRSKQHFNPNYRLKVGKDSQLWWFINSKSARTASGSEKQGSTCSTINVKLMKNLDEFPKRFINHSQSANEIVNYDDEDLET